MLAASATYAAKLKRIKSLTLHTHTLEGDKGAAEKDSQPPHNAKSYSTCCLPPFSSSSSCTCSCSPFFSPFPMLSDDYSKCKSQAHVCVCVESFAAMLASHPRAPHSCRCSTALAPAGFRYSYSALGTRCSVLGARLSFRIWCHCCRCRCCCCCCNCRM